MKKILVLLISCILLISCTKTDIRIQGFVTYNGHWIQDVSISIQKSNKTFETITDRGGYYKFDNVPVGTWTLTVEMEGCETQTETFSVSGWSSENIYQKNFELKLAPKPE
ncbi:MAG: carboxypeptidase regulatory-like domain-containing protein [Bacteroidetes bacterium]|nr:carboxypeptidase regulatory-like domain-containing protein [Bacteroidota bacterium]MCL2302215.1 carboxypeptidase regulatory-like domain-containing protein [Lentimicrobiaceae bacterium]MCL2302295.1 carboxypeptidase regulatory-like domain-containing protein [Lentimicrobiaceae bacterium]